MQQWAIVAYELAWNNNTNQGLVGLFLQGGQPGRPNVTLQVSNADALQALALVLSHKPVFYRADGFVLTGEIPS